MLSVLCGFVEPAKFNQFRLHKIMTIFTLGIFDGRSGLSAIFDSLNLTLVLGLGTMCFKARDR